MKKRIYFMATIAIAALLVAQGVRVAAAESEPDPPPGGPCPAEPNLLLGICVLDTESRPVCVFHWENQNCTSSK